MPCDATKLLEALVAQPLETCRYEPVRMCSLAELFAAMCVALNLSSTTVLANLPRELAHRELTSIDQMNIAYNSESSTDEDFQREIVAWLRESHGLRFFDDEDKVLSHIASADRFGISRHRRKRLH